MYPSNTFVNADWNIKYIIDLEWVCSLPVAMQQPPIWLTSRRIDELTEKDLDAYDEVRKEFMHVFEGEEKGFPPGERIILLRSNIVKNACGTGSFWYFYALNCTTGILSVFYQHILPKFASSHFADEDYERIIFPYWTPDASEFESIMLR